MLTDKLLVNGGVTTVLKLLPLGGEKEGLLSVLKTLPLLEAAVGNHGKVGLPDGLLDPVRVPVSGAVEGGVVRSNSVVGLKGVDWLIAGVRAEVTR